MLFIIYIQPEGVQYAYVAISCFAQPQKLVNSNEPQILLFFSRFIIFFNFFLHKSFILFSANEVQMASQLQHHKYIKQKKIKI
jgi:hypothetical protein